VTKRLLDSVCRRLAIPSDADAAARMLLHTEWLITNGLGGYASGTAAGVITRRYHGLLVAALPNPLGRTVMLNHLSERMVLHDGHAVFLGAEERAAGPIDNTFTERIKEMRLEAGLPVWEYEWRGVRIERRIVMPHLQNTVQVHYRLLDGADAVDLELHPAVHFRNYEDAVAASDNSPSFKSYTIASTGDMHALSAPGDMPPLRMIVVGAPSLFVAQQHVASEFVYPVEESRGYEFHGTLWTPGHVQFQLARGRTVTLVASTEPSDVMNALAPDEVMSYEMERRRRLVHLVKTPLPPEIGPELVLAADQFIIMPAGRMGDRTRADALGDDVRTVIAGYHWFTDWGRDTMISLEGLALVTGRAREADFILRTFAHYVRDGLIPNMFPDGSNEGLYNTADATLWFFHALERYVEHTGDRGPLVHLLPVLTDIISHHERGTKFGIGMDPGDALLREGADGYQLTWMDAKVGDWVVTPRRGKAVEINALWYNALRLLERWTKDIRGDGSEKKPGSIADRVRESFNKRFWCEKSGYLYDVVDGPDGDSTECRPNQIFSISLAHPVLDRSRWQAVMDVVQQRLLTPVGLRSLAPGEKEFKARYSGDRRSRDAAYHQGTVWPWLIGPWIDAWLKVHPDDRAGARRFLDGCIEAIGSYGLGTIGEIFDAEPPFAPRGCIAQAWSVGEVLRTLALTAPPSPPRS
jgi:predicted glycogen debranching enzyme